MKLYLPLIASLLLPLASPAAIILIPEVTSDTPQINNLNRTLFHDSGAATFETLSNYGTVQNISYNGIPSANNSIILDYNDASSTADVRFRFSENAGNNSVTNNSYRTSKEGDRIRLQPSEPELPLTLTIDFGILSGTSFSSNRAVSAAGFTLSGTFANNEADSVVVTYYNAVGKVLDIQPLTTGGSASHTNNDRWAFTGWQNTTGDSDNDIAYITVVFSQRPEAPSSTVISLGDFGFAGAARR